MLTRSFAIAMFLVLTGVSRSACAADFSDVAIDPVVRVGGATLVLNGSGLRQRFKTDVYIIGLYLPETMRSAEAAIDHAGPKRIALRMMRDVTAQALVEALYEVVRDNTTAADFQMLKPAADTLSLMMLPLKVAKRGDVIALDYLPDMGSQIVVNGRAAGKPVPGRDLYRALLKIWLGDVPVDANLKLALLAGRRPSRP